MALVGGNQDSFFVGPQGAYPGHVFGGFNDRELAVMPAQQFSAKPTCIDKITPARHKQFIVGKRQHGCKASGDRTIQTIPLTVAVTAYDSAVPANGKQLSSWRTCNAAQIGLCRTGLFMPLAVFKGQYGTRVSDCPRAASGVASNVEQRGVF